MEDTSPQSYDGIPTSGELTRDLMSHKEEQNLLHSGSLKTQQISITVERLFLCIHCDKAFSRSNNLKTHQFSHTGERWFVCTHCDMALSRSGDLKKHKLIHTSEKKFTCTQCDRTFCRSSTLNRHMRFHTGESGLYAPSAIRLSLSQVPWRDTSSLTQERKSLERNNLFASSATRLSLGQAPSRDTIYPTPEIICEEYLQQTFRESKNAALRTSHRLSKVSNCSFQKYWRKKKQ